MTLEATGHYWKNLFAALVTRGFSVALINPLRSRRFPQEDLERTKTDAIDALGLARFGAQKRPAVTGLPRAAFPRAGARSDGSGPGQMRASADVAPKRTLNALSPTRLFS
jgi:hypothetical protein